MKKSEKLFHLNYSKKRSLIIVFSVILLLMIYFFKGSSMTLRVLTSISTMLLFYIFDNFFNINFRKRHYAFMLIITIFGVMLSHFYFIYPNFDKFQHFISPIMMGSIIFYTINSLKLEMRWKLLFTFFVTFAILGLFEIGEFTLDSLFDLKLQGVFLRDLSGLEKFNLLMDPLKDTMIDLVLGMIGTLIYCSYKFIYFRKKLRSKIFKED